MRLSLFYITNFAIERTNPIYFLQNKLNLNVFCRTNYYLPVEQTFTSCRTNYSYPLQNKLNIRNRTNYGMPATSFEVIIFSVILFSTDDMLGTNFPLRLPEIVSRVGRRNRSDSQVPIVRQSDARMSSYNTQPWARKFQTQISCESTTSGIVADMEMSELQSSLLKR